MLRPTILLVVLVYILNNNIAAATELTRNARSFNLNTGELDINSLISNSFGNISSIITFLKSQFRDIVIDLGIEMVKFIRSILHEFKVRLFKRLGKYTLSDVFHFVFDGVFEFVGESDSEEIIDVQNKTLDSSIYDPNYAFPDPYLLDKLIRAAEEK
ncbi:unnamed protein product, partial [Brenthis ino]